jgi:glycosyltransferase involved in cell wall biosynthesis
MFRFENRTVLIISPQPWDHLLISKHHYALELATRGNRVFFLEPPDTDAPSRVTVRPAQQNPLIRIVHYRPAFPFVIRFHARPVYNRLILWQIRALKAAVREPIDVVWSFDFNLFSNLRAFRPRLSLFHPVDPVSLPHQIDVARSADAVFSVSEQILSNFRHLNVPRWFINHGLSRPFEEIARNPAPWRQNGRARVGYAGNLMRRPVNRSVLRAMVESNPDVEFHFWGTAESTDDVEADAIRFVEFLGGATNVTLHGVVSPADLAKQLQEMDCMILAYSADARESDRSNSHKILEYLSTGKVVVSSRISTYEKQPEMLRMPDSDDDSSLPGLLQDTLARLPEFNSERLQSLRRSFALDNTYAKQLDRIESRLKV